MGAVWKWALNVVVLGGLGVGGWFAYQHGLVKKRATAAEVQATDIAVRVCQCIAKTSAGGALPKTTEPFPAALEESHEGKSTITSADIARLFSHCDKENAVKIAEELKVQFRWVRMGEKLGRFYVQADANQDGKADDSWELPVFCEPNKCMTANYVFTIDEEGVRNPPGLMLAVGFEEPYQGPPASIEADSFSIFGVTPDGTKEEKRDAGASTKAPERTDAQKSVHKAVDEELEKMLAAGQPIPYSRVQEAILSKAGADMPKASLVGVEVTGLSASASGSDNVDTKAGAMVRFTFAELTTATGIERGDPIQMLSFGATGLTTSTEKATGEMSLLDPPTSACSPLQAAAASGATGAALARDRKIDRQLWLLVGAPKKNSVVAGDSCAIVRR